MHVSQLIYSDLPSTDYSMINDCIDQIKNFLLSTGLVSVISDNNPPPSQARIVVFKVGISNHYIKIFANDRQSIKASLQKLENTSEVYPLIDTAYTVNNTYANLIYGNNNLVFIFNDNIKTEMTYLKISSNDALIGKGSQNRLFLNVDDNAFILDIASVKFKTTTGKWIFLPIFVAKHSLEQIDESLQPIAYSVSKVDLTKGRIYRDENGRYYACILDGVLVPDI